MFGVFPIDEILRYRGTRFPGSRTLCHPGISQNPLAGCVVVFNSGGVITQDDHVAIVFRQLLWGKEFVDQG